MRVFPIKTVGLSILLSLSAGCSWNNVDQVTNSDAATLIVGRWNSYEMGTEAGGFTKGISTSLTIAYESGITFLSDGTFKNRHHYDNNWTESPSVGSFTMKDKTITLLYFAGTKDELKIDLHLLKLDENYLWFKHNYFGPEFEYHLTRNK
jgi:hypothetical protein